ncbi:hypothetical protein L596_014951 [Steinernema carpocapsae]|uniref:Uncharacterized protein n=1 Tax=Steinernema carpocapsae TaxID=34508 RepID=A0A4U5NDF6_STECR|nr:hypothetical protein L596_014951 [Steinernema carpocapsae]
MRRFPRLSLARDFSAPPFPTPIQFCNLALVGNFSDRKPLRVFVVRRSEEFYWRHKVIPALLTSVGLFTSFSASSVLFVFFVNLSHLRQSDLWNAPNSGLVSPQTLSTKF